MGPYTSAFADVGGLRLHYLEWPGEGTTVLCLPGITANAHAFIGVAEALSPGHRVLAIDLRGRGESDKPAHGYDVGTHAEDVAAFLAGLGITRAAIVGWSLGGRVALALAARHPRCVERVVLIDPPVETSPAAAATLRTFWERLDNTYESVETFLVRMRTSWVFTEWSPYVERYLLADVEEQPDGVVRHRIPRHVPEEELSAEARHPTRSFYHRVGSPVLILRAPRPLVREGDQVLGGEDAREMAASLPDARLVEIEGANHFSILLGKPRTSLEAITAFLRDDALDLVAEPREVPVTDR